MPYAKTSTGYPLEMKLAIQKVVEMNQEMEIDCGSPGMAKNLRGRYYQYLAAVKRDADRPPAQWTEQEKKDNLEFLRAFVTVEFYPKGQFFYIRPRDLAPWAIALSKGKMVDRSEEIVAEYTEPSQHELDLAARLMAAQEKKLKGE